MNKFVVGVHLVFNIFKFIGQTIPLSLIIYFLRNLFYIYNIHFGVLSWEGSTIPLQENSFSLKSL